MTAIPSSFVQEARALGLALLFAPASAIAPAFAQDPSGPATLPVGFRVDRLPDSTRPFELDLGMGPRPIMVYMWYPAADSCGTPMTWNDVVEWVGVEGTLDSLDAEHATAGRSEFVGWIGSVDGDTTAARAALRFPLRACDRAAPAPGRHPLVLFSAGRDDSPAMHALLGEELASRGWAVLGTGGLGARVRQMEFAPADIEAQVADLGALASHARSLDFVDPTRPVVVGFSFGGGVAILYAMQDSAVAAVVSLDGSIGFADRVPTYVSLPGWHPERARSPVLHVRATDEERKDLSALESLAAPVAIETIDGATHHDFTILGPVSANGLVIAPLGLDDADGDELHAEILRGVVAFLEEHRPGASE